MSIHPTATIDRGAEIDSTAEIGPCCVIGPHVKIAAKTQLLAHVVVQNHTTIGQGNTIHPFAVIGGAPQDLKFRGEPSRLVIGDDNIIRESATLNIGTEGGHMETRIGNGCLLMAYTHVAHDCHLGDQVILANNASLAGHVDVGNKAILGGMAGVHQFCRVGRHAFLAGGAMVVQDVPPFCIAQGDRAHLVGINVIGLRRAGFSREKIHTLRDVFKRLFLTQTTRLVALERTEKEMANSSEEVQEFCAFIRQAERGICQARFDNSSTEITDES